MTQTIDNSQLDSEELVSGLLDEQITSEELSELLSDDRVNESFYRYNLVSKVLREELIAPVSMDFVNSVSQKLDSEPTILAPSTKTQHLQTSSNTSTNNVVPLFSKIKKLTGGMAIAASVAVATFVSVQSVQIADHEGVFNSELATQQSAQQSIKQTASLAVDANNAAESIEPANEWLDTAEQKELEFFNDMFMSKARQSEQGSIAPFARVVRGQRIGTFRYSKEEWEYILRRSIRTQHEKTLLENSTEEKKVKENTPK